MKESAGQDSRYLVCVPSLHRFDVVAVYHNFPRRWQDSGPKPSCATQAGSNKRTSKSVAFQWIQSVNSVQIDPCWQRMKSKQARRYGKRPNMS